MVKKILKILWNIFEVTVIAYVIFMTAYILCRNKFGFTHFNKYTFVILNEENYKFVPNYDEGDLLVIESKKFGIEEGSTIYYYVVANNTYVVKSGIVKSKVEDNYSVIYYLDDDALGSVSSNRVIGQDVKFSSDKGYILEFLESRIGFLIFVLLPVMLIFIYRIYDLFVSSKYRNIDSVEDDNEESNVNNIGANVVAINSETTENGVDNSTNSVAGNLNTVENNSDASTNSVDPNLINNSDASVTNYLDNVNKPIISEKVGFNEVESIVEYPQIINNIPDNEVSSVDETEIL